MADYAAHEQLLDSSGRNDYQQAQANGSRQRLRGYLQAVCVLTVLFNVTILVLLMVAGFAPGPNDQPPDGPPYKTHAGIYLEQFKIFSV
jgi:hypothetical protein